VVERCCVLLDQGADLAHRLACGNLLVQLDVVPRRTLSSAASTSVPSCVSAAASAPAPSAIPAASSSASSWRGALRGMVRRRAARCRARCRLALPRGVVAERARRPCNRTRHTQDVDTLSGADRINEGAHNHLAASPRAWLFVSEWTRGQARRRLTTDLVSMCPAARTGNPCPRRRHQPARGRSAFARNHSVGFHHSHESSSGEPAVFF
jgi:hypothetical protein